MSTRLSPGAWRIVCGTGLLLLRAVEACRDRVMEAERVPREPSTGREVRCHALEDAPLVVPGRQVEEERNGQ